MKKKVYCHDCRYHKHEFSTLVGGFVDHCQNANNKNWNVINPLNVENNCKWHAKKEEK